MNKQDYFHVLIINIVAIILLVLNFYSYFFIVIFLTIPNAVKFNKWSILNKKQADDSTIMNKRKYFRIVGVSFILFIFYSVLENLIHVGWGNK